MTKIWFCCTNHDFVIKYFNISYNEIVEEPFFFSNYKHAANVARCFFYSQILYNIHVLVLELSEFPCKFLQEPVVKHISSC